MTTVATAIPSARRASPSAHAAALERGVDTDRFDPGKADRDAGPEKEDPTAGMSPNERVHWMVLHRKKEGIEEVLDADTVEWFKENGGLRRFVNVYVDGEDIRFGNGLDTPVADGQEVQILPAVAGG